MVVPHSAPIVFNGVQNGGGASSSGFLLSMKADPCFILFIVDDADDGADAIV